MKTMETPAMPEPHTITLRADALQPELARLVKTRPIPNPRVRITVEVEEPTHDEWLEAARAGVEKGRAEIAAGLGLDGETALQNLYKKHFGTHAK